MSQWPGNSLAKVVANGRLSLLCCGKTVLQKA
jgi:hypothetical protein